MRSCIWITSAVGSSDSAFSRATEAPATAFSLPSAPTTAYPVIFFSILTAMAVFPVCCVCGTWCGGDGAKSGALTPTPLPLRGRGAQAGYFFFAALRTVFLALAFLAGALRAAFFGAAFFAAFFTGAFLAALRGAAFFAGAFFAAFFGAAFFVAFLAV